MDTDKKKLLADFSHRALQRLRDKKIPKRQTLHIPSMDMDLTIRSLDYGEIMECMTLEDNGDIKRSDKYSIYLAAVEPSLRDTAKEVMAMEAELPPEDRELKEPLDIVNMFDLSEITQISTAIMELSGAMNGKVTVVEDKKVIAQDGDAYLLHYYIQKGWKAEEFLSLDLESRLFYQASMLVALDERAKMFSLE